MFQRATWEIEDHALYITLFNGLVCGGYLRDRITVGFENEALREVRQVCLRGCSSTRLIYFQ